MWITSCLDTIKTPTVVALGNFDGVHLGHQKVIEPVVSSFAVQRTIALSGTEFHADAYASSANALSTAVPTVVTFHPHPQEFFTGQRRELLTPPLEKSRFLSALGVEQLVLLPFTQMLSSLTPQAFVEKILIEQLQAREISVGQDFRFGQKRAGTTADLKAIAALYDVAVHVVPLFTLEGDRVSSSAIRAALQAGDLTRANGLLGRPYSLVGEVVYGQQLGRQIGFPTANLRLPEEKFLPRFGVYAVWAELEAGSKRDRLPAVMNIGCRPTVEGIAPTAEVHLLEGGSDLYGQTLTVSLQQFLRPEQKFSSLDALKEQIQRDCEQARSLLSSASGY